MEIFCEGAELKRVQSAAENGTLLRLKRGVSIF